MKQKKLVVVGILMLFGLFLSMNPVDSALAGSNGQQLKIRTGCLWSSVTVTGTNQHGQRVTWRASNSNSYFCGRSEVSTTGWWWVGKVTIAKSFPIPTLMPTKYCTVNVPKDQSGHWISTTC